MNLEQQRQKSQLAFSASNINILVGSLEDFPLTLEQLKSTTPDSSYVVETFDSGLTAVVYHIRVHGKSWTLKCKREESLVKNVDGQTSFLNEVQRRQDLTALKCQYPGDFNAIVETHFASFRDGIILSSWIDGDSIETLNQHIFEQVFNTIVNLELNGLFEWDFCAGNLLLDKKSQVRLFDFGYMYRFDPLIHFNNNGLETPLFNGIERFETRFFFDYLLKNRLHLSDQQQFELYRTEKSCALAAYQRKHDKLVELEASESVLQWHKETIDRWQMALSSEQSLTSLYHTEAFRSNVLDLVDDVHGKSCSLYTLKKADFIIERLEKDFELLSKTNGLFFGDERLSRSELITKYKLLKQSAEQYQLK